MKPIDILQKYYHKDSELYSILVLHSTQVKNKAVSIASKHPELNLDIDFIKEASMMHDIGIFMCNAPRINCTGSHQYIEHGYLGADLLRKEGFAKHALVCERHTGVGLSLEIIIKSNFPLPQRDMRPISWEEQIICYADKFYSKTKVGKELSVEKIRLQLSKYGDESVRKFNFWHEIFS